MAASQVMAGWHPVRMSAVRNDGSRDPDARQADVGRWTGTTFQDWPNSVGPSSRQERSWPAPPARPWPSRRRPRHRWRRPRCPRVERRPRRPIREAPGLRQARVRARLRPVSRAEGRHRSNATPRLPASPRPGNSVDAPSTTPAPGRPGRPRDPPRPGGSRPGETLSRSGLPQAPQAWNAKSFGCCFSSAVVTPASRTASPVTGR